MLTEPVFGLGSWAFNNAPGNFFFVAVIACLGSGEGNGMVGEGKPHYSEAY